ncbi:SulP family inorganic anion transporter [Alsobacter sp. R-9]
METPETTGDAPTAFFRLMQGLLPIRPSDVPRDVLAGVTLAALGIPEVMGYTKIAGTPVVTGLYTILLPLIVFAILGSSRHLVVAADSATAAILAGTLTGAAALGSAHYVELTGLTALLVGIMLFAARLLRLGFLADFLSRSALIGFLTGVGVQVAIGELSGLIGLEKQGHGSAEQLLSFLRRLGEFHLPTLLVVVGVLGTIILFERFAPKVPGALIAVIGAIASSALFNLQDKGIKVIGAVPSGLPHLTLPTLDMGSLSVVATAAASCFVVVLAQSAATSRAYANRYNERFDENTDLVGLAGANAAAALTGTFVVNGSPTKTEMVDEAGGRSQLTHLTTAVIVLMVLLFLTGPLSLLPAAVLSAIVFLIGVKLVDYNGLSELFHVQRDEWVVAVMTALVVVGLGVMDGILAAVLLSLIAHVRHSYRLRTRLLVPDGRGGFAEQPVTPDHQAAPGVFVYRFEADVFYANCGRFTDEVLRLAGRAGTTTVIIDASGIDSIDFTAAKALMQLHAELERRGVRMIGVAVNDDVAQAMDRYRKSEGPNGRLFSSVDAALQDAIETSGAGR